MLKEAYKSRRILCLFMAVMIICGVFPMETSAEPTGEEPDAVECIVAFDPDDGRTGYKDFYKTTVHKGDKITDIPEDPKRDGYFFAGWYAYTDASGFGVYWDFESDTVEENTTLWAEWDEGYIVAYDPDDGRTGYKDFYKTTVQKNDKVTDIPDAPKRDGYFFKGWYAFLDKNGDPVYWDFDRHKVTENTTLWADWEEGCIVVFDPDDGEAQYKDFYKTTVHKGDKVTDIPEDPQRDGYFFKGWYAYLDDEGPVYWNFEDDVVEENTTLWADWEEGCIVVFDPDDGEAQYKDFYKTTVHKGDKVTDIPEDPQRDGYFFKGWYAYLDDEGPVYWNFEDDVVEENTTLWADWDLGKITKNSSTDKITIGKSFTYTITVVYSEHAESIWEDVIARDVLNDELDYIGYKSEDGVVVSANGRELTIDFGDVNIGESKTVTITVRVNNSGKIGTVIENRVITDDGKTAIDPNGPKITEEKQEEKPEKKPEKKPGKETEGPSNGDEKEIVITGEIPLGLLKDDHIAYVQGYPEGDFRPENPITRAESAQIFYNLLIDVDKTGYYSSFSDVKSSSWYADAIHCLSANNIILGYPDETYKPDQYITRAEFAAIASRFDNLSSDNNKSFIDLANSHWAYKYIMSASDKGWISGYPDNTFRPEQNITRSEVVKIVNNMLGRGIKSEDIPKNLHTLYSDLTIEHWAFGDIIEASVEHLYTRDKDGWEIWE
ncbi:InlB B-repeat-containing protein [Sedimentibacter hydroxybenzoicus DSM 7310]|uniref:InlB B-repeat-containing protein n=1 Tax=Sedimentibacter hydroxybenzoicus DSM 7310 TaxID=1123245 RepID=A0A974BKZ2_SEDHY|nr:InlB B-repeat-containing protein [Sedimentibacter hydroxybenzoicus]NYB74982.1 InlB B-repeat-containing protein [Sedimentibacter hydroxybenzoicus DSM 7310]